MFHKCKTINYEGICLTKIKCQKIWKPVLNKDNKIIGFIQIKENK